MTITGVSEMIKQEKRKREESMIKNHGKILTVNGIVKYLEDEGYGVSLRFDNMRNVHRISIAKDDTVLTQEFAYPGYLKGDSESISSYIQRWLEMFIGEFEKKYFNAHPVTRMTRTNDKDRLDAYIKSTLAAGEFLKEANNIMNSPEQKLVGDLINGYTYKGHDSEPIAIGPFEFKETNGGINITMTPYNSMFAYASRFAIDRVVFNNPATIVFWKDGSKTVVKADNEPFDPEKGLAMAIAKKALGNQGNYFNVIKKWVGDNESEVHKQAFIRNLLELAVVTNATALEDRRKRDEKAYELLIDVLDNKKALKTEMVAAMREAIGYLGENLED